ncbi:MAG: chemoreceptor glutamine deamidase CheD, partial [Pseudomonadota bacterium]|nr:chemoreceptor glutamine deamidase CheD [Pseudomonadota bacterium]
MSSHFKPVLPGFDHVKRFWDGKRHKVVAKVLPG